jgi:hypothetical protein
MLKIIYYFQDHTNNIEKLNIKNIAYHSVKEAMASLLHTMNIIYNIGTKIPSAVKEPKVKSEKMPEKDPV